MVFFFVEQKIKYGCRNIFELITIGHAPMHLCALNLVSTVYRVSQEEMPVFWNVIVSVYMNMCPIPNAFLDGAISPYNRLDLASNIVLPSSIWIGVKRQLAVVTVDSDTVGVLWKMPHIFINAEYADMLYAFLKRDESALMLTVKFSKMYNTRYTVPTLSLEQ
jgi:hypothetical protein